MLRSVFGYDRFRPGQQQAVDALLARRDLLAVMPTGAGKSICYQLPALLSGGVTLVVSPLISLMRDQVMALSQLGVRAAYINSTLTPAQQQRALQNAAAGRYKIVYVAPERLLTGAFLSFAQSAPIDYVIVDEAHCVSQWGQDFRPGYLSIAPFLQALPVRPAVGAFTATATDAVRTDVLRLIGLQDPVRVLTGFDRPNLYFEVRRPQKRDEELLAFVRAHRDASGIVYCATRKATEEVSGMLAAHGLPVGCYHAGLPDEERTRVQEDFVSDRLPLIVATNAFGMGIDKSNVSFVVHYQMPKDLESYYQEAGRAGRDGEPATCLLLYRPQDVRLQNFFIDRQAEDSELSPDEQAVFTERARIRLREMTFYATTSGCLRRRILAYFGEQAPERCGNCSCCRPPQRAAGSAKDRGQARATGRRLDGTPAQEPASQPLYRRLSALRKQIAEEQQALPFLIFTNATLREMAVHQPRTREAMLRVSGVGEAKMARYGERFVREIVAWQEEAACKS